MGLDMYLERMPRHRGATASDVCAVEDYLDWLRAKADGKESANCPFTEWCGREKSPSKDNIEFYADYYKARYSEWDKEHQYPWMRITEQVGYWRKANQIHNWFVEHVQDGVDDCNYHREVTEEDLNELLDVCQLVLNNCNMTYGQIQNGWEIKDGKQLPIMVSGKYVEDPSVAEKLLPSTSGFFFGSTAYDQYYVEDIKKTIEIVKKVLETTDFDTQMIYYISSW